MQKLIVANWKANKSQTQAQTWLKTISAEAKKIDLTKISPVLAPAFSLLTTVQSTITQLNWQLAIQDISAYPAGSYTGAVSAVNLWDLPITYVIVGHSERRQYFKETAQDVALKVDQAIEAKITPIICVSEQTLTEQANLLNSTTMQHCVIAYEPPEAIGSGHNVSLATVKDFQIQVKQLFGSIPFLSGGSVNEQNVGEYLLITDGALIGTASLKAEQFIKLLQTAQGDQPAVA